jgi:glycosyltransferase involved in cell wall biosynthesis
MGPLTPKSDGPTRPRQHVGTRLRLRTRIPYLPPVPSPHTGDKPPRIALIADWLAQFGGAESVIAEMAATFPGAPLFALFDVMAPADRARIQARTTITSSLQRIPGIGRRYRSLLPLMPLAIRQADLSGFDIIVSSHHSVAKGARIRDDQVHICYCHTPMRYAWERRDEYLADHAIRGPAASLARAVLERIRLWDLKSVALVDRFLVNSAYVGERVRRNYGRESTVLHPPVDVGFFTPDPSVARDVFVTASRHVPYKRIDRVVDAFRALPEHRLVVLGDGPQSARIRDLAGGFPNIDVRGEVRREELRQWFRRARAFVFAAEEDFGIVPLEAQACGTPVLALRKGGVLETVRGDEGAGRTGLFFADDSPAAIIDAVRRFTALTTAIAPDACRMNAERFAPPRFRAALRAEVMAAYEAERGAA